MKREINISKIEKILVNLCTPLLYGAYNEEIPFQDIAKSKEDSYKRLVKYLESDGKIPWKVQSNYHKTICGNIAVATAYGRKIYKNFESEETKNS